MNKFRIAVEEAVASLKAGMVPGALGTLTEALHDDDRELEGLRTYHDAVAPLIERLNDSGSHDIILRNAYAELERLRTDSARVVAHPRIPLAEDDRPQDEGLDGAGWTFTTHEHGGDFPDTMPQCICGTDPQGRSWLYEASEGPAPKIEPSEERDPRDTRAMEIIRKAADLLDSAPGVARHEPAIAIAARRVSKELHDRFMARMPDELRIALENLDIALAAQPGVARHDDTLREIARAHQDWASGSIPTLQAMDRIDGIVMRAVTLGDARWISVSERLPEQGHVVIVQGGIASFHGDDRWVSQTGPAFGRKIEWTVTHWQPLPALSESPSPVAQHPERCFNDQPGAVLCQVCGGDLR